ncbi:hypothetical protein RJ639_012182 [Escallonia herrerae]|uniref:Uncharacterized protein n=1 Tax=Escallonia herrerae TaxID=1293975 RepID=A0AA89AUG6_9ASTE|nr:hypothetical protein RJ639_012182 [Escallonia herrerae]
MSSWASRWVELNFSVPTSIFRWPRLLSSYFTPEWSPRGPRWASEGFWGFPPRGLTGGACAGGGRSWTSRSWTRWCGRSSRPWSRWRWSRCSASSSSSVAALSDRMAGIRRRRGRLWLSSARHDGELCDGPGT